MRIDFPGLKTKPFLQVPGSEIQFPHAEVCQLGWSLADPLVQVVDPVHVVMLDTETAAVGEGIDIDHDVVIEATFIRVLVDANNGKLVEIVELLTMFNDPGFALTEETTAFTGITQDMVSGKAFDQDLIAQFIGDDVLIAHNASFDRAMLERVLPCVAASRWACSCKGDVNWYDLGYASSGLEYLAFKNELYFTAHRSAPDVFALIYVLSRNPNAMYSILSNELRSTTRVMVTNTPYDQKSFFNSNGYQAEYDNKTFKGWFKDFTTPESVEIEIANISALMGHLGVGFKKDVFNSRTRYKRVSKI